MNNRLKQIIFDKLYYDLKHVEIIPYADSIWFIDRKEKFWYFEYEKSGELWWRWQFFYNFFALFSLEFVDFEPIISEWVEEVLNCKVNTTINAKVNAAFEVEEVLNCKVNTTCSDVELLPGVVEEVLNYKVITPHSLVIDFGPQVEKVLNCKVSTPSYARSWFNTSVENVLNHKNN